MIENRGPGLSYTYKVEIYNIFTSIIKIQIKENYNKLNIEKNRNILFTELYKKLTMNKFMFHNP